MSESSKALMTIPESASIDLGVEGEDIDNEADHEQILELFQDLDPQHLISHERSHPPRMAWQDFPMPWRRYGRDGPWNHVDARHPLQRYIHRNTLYDLIFAVDESFHSWGPGRKRRSSTGSSSAGPLSNLDSGMGQSVPSTLSRLIKEEDRSINDLAGLLDTLKLPAKVKTGKRSLPLLPRRIIPADIDRETHTNKQALEIYVEPQAALHVRVGHTPFYDFHNLYDGIDPAGEISFGNLAIGAWEPVRGPNLGHGVGGEGSTYFNESLAMIPARPQNSVSLEPEITQIASPRRLGRKRHAVTSQYNGSMDGDEDGDEAADDLETARLHKRPRPSRDIDEIPESGKSFGCCFGRSEIPAFYKCQETSVRDLSGLRKEFMIRKHIKRRHEKWFPAPEGTRVISNKYAKTWQDIFKLCLPLWDQNWPTPSPYSEDPLLKWDSKLLEDLYEAMSCPPAVPTVKNSVDVPSGYMDLQTGIRYPTESSLTAVTTLRYPSSLAAAPESSKLFNTLYVEPVNGSMQISHAHPTCNAYSLPATETTTAFNGPVAVNPSRNQLAAYRNGSETVHFQPQPSTSFFTNRNNLLALRRGRTALVEATPRQLNEIVLVIERWMYEPENQGLEEPGVKFFKFTDERQMRMSVEAQLREIFHTPEFSWKEWFLVERGDPDNLVNDTNGLVKYASETPSRQARFYLVQGGLPSW